MRKKVQDGKCLIGFHEAKKKTVAKSAIEKEVNIKQSPNQSPTKENFNDKKLEKNVLTNKERSNFRFIKF